MTQFDITIKRKFTLDRNFYVGVYVDQNYIGKIKRGESLTTKVDKGPHIIKVEQGFNSGTLKINVDNQTNNTFIFRPTKAALMPLLFLSIAFIISFQIDLTMNQIYVVYAPGLLIGLYAITFRSNSYYKFEK
jgi:hypothetical protein